METQSAVNEETSSLAYDAAGILNVAAAVTGTRSLGPGLRSAVWVQGCAIHCPECIAPEWIALKPAHLIAVEDLAEFLLTDPNVHGLTFSGGEPMLQAPALARLARMARAIRDIDIICFTGFTRHVLENNPPVHGVHDLIANIDVLIDGPYIARLNDNRGLRGSKNQRIHYLTERLCHANLEDWHRRSEIKVMDGQAVMIGVPPKRLGEAFNRAINLAQDFGKELLSYERV